MNLYPLWRSWITIIFYWSPIKLTLEKPLKLWHFNKFRLSPLLQTEKWIFEWIWRKNPYKQIVFSIFFYNLFFRMSQNMKRWWDAILQKNPVHILGLTTGIGANIPGLINLSNYRISQDISLQWDILLYFVVCLLVKTIFSF